ncbi:nucleolar and coiled-body phosphoprotein 1-like [Anabrus simplex]|uniref:nucleolar and coiled-body phosphoprotein 1-like n=1 Tax=Anabrus simplex TaxID=316456 RepID=UPI0035A28E3E
MNSKKAKEGESAIKKVVKKKIIVKKKQPKIESECANVVDGASAGGSAPSKETKVDGDQSSEAKSVVKGTTSSSSSNNNKINKPVSNKMKCITKNPKSAEVAKKSSSKKLTSKATKVISSKAKKVLPTLKKVQSATKKVVPKKTVIQESSSKEAELTVTASSPTSVASSAQTSSLPLAEAANSEKEEENPEKLQQKPEKLGISEEEVSPDVAQESKPSPQSSARANDDDSSTSDEIPLDLLLLRQQEWKRAQIANELHEQGSLTEEDLTSDRSPLGEITKAGTSSMTSPGKLEEHSSLSPANMSLSDEENLRALKNKIRGNVSDSERKPSSPLSSKKDDKKKSSAKTDTLKEPQENIDAEKEFEKVVGKKSKGKAAPAKPEKDEVESDSDSDSDQEMKSRTKDLLADDDSEEEKLPQVKKQFKKPNPKIVKEDDDGDADDDDDDDDNRSVYRRMLGIKRGRSECGSGSDTEQRARRMKLFGFWSGPKRHRVASLNALAKVHCLYENESRGALLGICRVASTPKPKPKLPRPAPKPQPKPPAPKEVEEVPSTRTLRALPGSRSIGKHWDMQTTSSTTTTSSDDNETNSDSGSTKPLVPPPSYKQKRQQQQEKDKDGAASSSSNEGGSSDQKKKSSPVNKSKVKKEVKRRRNRSELKMDLKDMVVKKRMASLNASAILAASYSVEKRPPKNIKEEKGGGSSTTSTTTSTPSATTSASDAPPQKKKSTTKKKVIAKKEVKPPPKAPEVSDVEIEELDLDAGSTGSGGHRSVIELRTSSGASSGQPSNKKVAVIVNQDTDVTITGVYVNSTTRSTRHEGFCSISGMQYRISSTSHTQTEATAVSTEKVLHTAAAPPEHPPATLHAPEPTLVPPSMKSYTPLGALSNMQPPGAPPPPPHPHAHPHPHPPPPPHPHPHPPHPHPCGPRSPLGRRHGCASAFSAPPPGPPAAYSQHPPPPGQPTTGPPPVSVPPPGQQDPAYIHAIFTGSMTKPKLKKKY